MSDTAFGGPPYSADIDLWLECEHGRIPLSHTAPDFVISATPRDLPRCEADVVVSVDGKAHRRRVVLCGMSVDEPRSAILPLEPAPF